ncbi:VOC family protein [Ornithinicoccus hortensis]|uniref:Putative pterin-4-alpha-carbinolamine dehydratase n=1 Tax=Ornithinicoccus hortensis TaxID=82346 RepID=A0A542YQY5_9MICO|nr:VOC family protein [Ornithinicoccus hortensis]TQL50505.1 4a-hydroxytetrahydrobiopterin dehydratase [Ornithinicoccus hortensis]
MSTPTDPVTPYDATHAEGLQDWRYGLGALLARFETGDFATGAALVQSIAEVADELNHHPDVDLRYPYVLVRTTSHDVGTVTSRDLELARRISALAAEVGAPPSPHEVSSLEVGIDTVDEDAIRPFWAAVLGYETTDDGDLVDPTGQRPAIWFQEMDPPRTDRNRIHFDLTVPHDVAEERLAAALAAGGRLVSDDRAPAFWVLADAEGNEVCICTWQNRPSSGGPSAGSGQG